MRWDNGCLETNLIPHLADDQLDAFIRDPDGDDGERLRTLADRAGSQDKSLAAIQAATDNLRQLMIEAACGNAPPAAAEKIKKEWKKHGQRGFKTTAGGVAQKGRGAWRERGGQE